MPKTFFKRIKPVPVGSATQHIVTSYEDMLASGRLRPEMSVPELLAALKEFDVKVWHMRCDGGQALFFLGDNAPDLVAQVYEFLYSK